MLIVNRRRCEIAEVTPLSKVLALTMTRSLSLNTDSDAESPLRKDLHAQFERCTPSFVGVDEESNANSS